MVPVSEGEPTTEAPGEEPTGGEPVEETDAESPEATGEPVEEAADEAIPGGSDAEAGREALEEAIAENPEAVAEFVRRLDAVNELLDVVELGTAAMDDRMVTELSGTGATLAAAGDGLARSTTWPTWPTWPPSPRARWTTAW